MYSHAVQTSWQRFGCLVFWVKRVFKRFLLIRFYIIVFILCRKWKNWRNQRRIQRGKSPRSWKRARSSWGASLEWQCVCPVSQTLPRKVGKSRDVYTQNEDSKSTLGEFWNEGNQRGVDRFGRRVVLHIYRAKNGDRASSGNGHNSNNKFKDFISSKEFQKLSSGKRKWRSRSLFKMRSSSSHAQVC